MVDIDLARQEFTDIFTSRITRQGADKLLEYLNGSDFFRAPASGRFHLATEGGLCQHSVNVYKRLLAVVKAEYGENYQSVVSDETIAICGLLHDVCKVNVPYYRVDERFPYGHGEKSVFILSQYLRLTAEEAMAINWHMGGFDDRVRGGSFSLSEAYAKYKLALLMHIADLSATYLDEER